MPPKGKPPKLTPAEKAAAKAKAAAIKARNAEYKRVAKLVKAKDLAKRSEGLDIISQDHEFLTAGNCLVPLIDGLVLTKKNVDVVMRALLLLKDFLSSQQPAQAEGESPESNVAFLLAAIVSKQETFKGLANISALLVHERAEFQLPALGVLKLATDVLLAGSATPHLNPPTLEAADLLVQQTENLPSNLGTLYTRLRAASRAEDGSLASEAAGQLNDMLVILAFLGDRDKDRLTPLLADEQAIGAVVASMQDLQLQHRASIVVDIVSKEEQGLRRVAEVEGVGVLAKVLDAQLELIKGSDVVQKAQQEAAAALAAAAALEKNKGKAKPTKPLSKKEEAAAAAAAAALAAARPPELLSFPLALENLSRMVEVLTRLCVAERSGQLSSLSGGSLEMSVRSLVGTLSVLMPWEYRKVFARNVCRALTVISGGEEARREAVRDTMSLGPLLDIISAPDASPEGVLIRRSAEAAMHHIISPLPLSSSSVDPSILTGTGTGGAPFLAPSALVTALGSDDTLTWQAALRLLARLMQAESNTSVLASTPLPALHKIAAWLVAKAGSSEHWPADAEPPSSVPIKALLIAFADSLTCIARGKDAAAAQGVGSDDMVGKLVGLLTQGPLSDTDLLAGRDRRAMCCYAAGSANPDVAFELFGPEHWDLDMGALEKGAVPQAIVPRARLVRSLAAIAGVGGTGGGFVVEKASGVVVKLLALDMDVGGQRRSWEAFVPRDQALLHDQLRLELLQLAAAVASLPNGREKLVESVSSFVPAWAPPRNGESADATAPWTPPTGFKTWDLQESEQPQALDGAYPFLRLLAPVLAPVFDADASPAMVDAGIQALLRLVWDRALPEGAQDALTDTLGGLAMSMGALVPLVSYASKAEKETSMGPAIAELAAYLINRGLVRQEHWANAPQLPPEEPVEAKGGKGKAGAKKKQPSPEEEAKRLESAPKGRPDPNMGPNGEQWQSLLSVTGKDTRRGKERCTPMLALIFAKADTLLQMLFKAGAKPVSVDERGRTPLMDALLHGNDAAAMELVDLGADVNAVDFEGTSVLKCAMVSPDKAEFDAKLAQLTTPEAKASVEVIAGIPTPQMLAGHGRLLRYLLEHGADPNVADDDGNFPLHWSLTGTYVTTFDEGVEITLTTDLRTKDVAPLKEQACTDMFDILGGMGADVNLVNAAGQSPLNRAIRGGRLHEAYELLRLGADPNVADAHGCLPLHLACMVAAPGYDTLLEALLDKGRNRAVHTLPHKNVRRGRSAVEKYSAVVEAVLDRGMPDATWPSVVSQRLYRPGELLSLPSAAGYVSVHYACGAGREGDCEDSRAWAASLLTRKKIVQRILGELEVTVGVQGTVDGWTPLHALARHVDDVSLLQVLLSLGADVNAVDAQGLTPLMHALRGGSVNVASALAQDSKTRPMVQEQGTLNALTFAVGVKGLVPGALFTLLQRTKRADPELDSLNVFAHTHGPVLEDGLGPLEPLEAAYTNVLCAAAAHDNVEAVDMLAKEPRLNVNIKDGPHSETALHVACGLGHERVVELLLQRGDLNYVARDAHGRTPLYAAVQGDYGGIMSRLLEKPPVRQAIMAELDDATLPSTLALAESLDLEAGEEGPRRHAARLVLQALGERGKRAPHLHECYAQGLTYAEWRMQQRQQHEAEERERQRRESEGAGVSVPMEGSVGEGGTPAAMGKEPAAAVGHNRPFLLQINTGVGGA